MKNRKIIKVLSLLMLTILLVSTFSLPVFATVDGEEEAPTFWDQFADTALYILDLICMALFAILFIIHSAIVLIVFIFIGVIWLLVELGVVLIDLIMVIVNGIIGLF